MMLAAAECHRDYRHRRCRHVHHGRLYYWLRPSALLMVGCCQLLMSTSWTLSFHCPGKYLPTRRNNIASNNHDSYINRMQLNPSRILVRKVTTTLPGIEMETDLIKKQSTMIDDDVDTSSEDSRPYEQRTKGPRKARRLNHSFRYLYRDNNSQYTNVTAMEYLLNIYSNESKIIEMNETFPPLLTLNVSRHVHPKIRFLQETILRMGGEGFIADDLDSYDNDNHHKKKKCDDIQLDQLDIPPHYFGSRLEKVLAPRHAFLVHVGLPHGRQLLFPTQQRWHDFLLSCRKTNQFCALCNKWMKEQRQQQGRDGGIVTSTQIDAFDSIFGRGLLSACRGDLAMQNNTWKVEQNLTLVAADVVQLLIQHGADPLERDVRGVSLLHWSCGTGNLDVVKVVLPYFDATADDHGTEDDTLLIKTERDGATLLHWAAAGANSKEFGTGGHVDVCEYILTECERRRRRTEARPVEIPPSSSSSTSTRRDRVSPKDLVNQLTKDGNSPLMWAAWSGSLDTVKLLVRHRADTGIANRNGCTVAHWAASGGSLEVCKYLGEVIGVDFFTPNHGGNTPLTHAVAFGRVSVVDWIRRRAVELCYVGDDSYGDVVAARLASDFVEWNSDSDVSKARKRRQILQMFVDDDVWGSVDSDSDHYVRSGRKIDPMDDNEELSQMLSLEEAQQLELDLF